VAVATIAPWRDVDLSAVKLEESADGKPRSWIMLMPVGNYEHPQYGKLDFTRSLLSEFKQHFDSRVRHIDIAFDRDHDAGEATGWLEQVQLRDDGLWGLVRWTTLGVQLLKDEIYRYFSPEFGPWEDPRTKKHYENVLIGGALTNRPFLKEMPAVKLTEVSHKSWASVNKSELPRSCFLVQGDPDDKSTWKLPVYEGAGEKDADGHYTQRGPLNINAVRAALAAIGGARQGKPMSGVPGSVKSKLERWLKQYGADSKAANEAGRWNVEDVKGRRLADGGDDGEDYAEDDGDGDDGFDKKSDTHGAMKCGPHSHGKYGPHSHDGDADHSDAPLKGEKSMSERRMVGEGEEVRQLREEVASLRYKLYETEVGKQLGEWSTKSFRFRDGTDSAGNVLEATGQVAISKRFRDQYRDFMLSDGVTMRDATRRKLNELIDTALSHAVVDLSRRGSSFDQEDRARFRATREERPSDALDAHARRLAEAAGKRVEHMSPAEKLDLYSRASKELSYVGDL
jgi:hypothetical protein